MKYVLWCLLIAFGLCYIITNIFSNDESDITRYYLLKNKGEDYKCGDWNLDYVYVINGYLDSRHISYHSEYYKMFCANDFKELKVLTW